MNKYKLSRQTRAPLVSVMLYMGLSAFLLLVALAYVSLLTPQLIENGVFFLIRATVLICSIAGMVFLAFGFFKADWRTYSFEVDSESIVRVWKSGREDICFWRDLRSISANGLELTFATDEGRVQVFMVDTILQDSLTDFAREVRDQIVANGKENLIEGAERRVYEEEIRLTKATLETSDLRWHIYTQIVPVGMIAVGIALYSIDGGLDILFLAPIGLAISFFGFLGVRISRRNAKRRLRSLEEQGAHEEVA